MCRGRHSLSSVVNSGVCHLSKCFMLKPFMDSPAWLAVIAESYEHLTIALGTLTHDRKMVQKTFRAVPRRKRRSLVFASFLASSCNNPYLKAHLLLHDSFVASQSPLLPHFP